MRRTWEHFNWEKMHRIFTLYLYKLLGCEYWIPEVYAQKLWLVTDATFIEFLESTKKTKGGLKFLPIKDELSYKLNKKKYCLKFNSEFCLIIKFNSQRVPYFKVKNFFQVRIQILQD